jgi:glycine cleavage system H protein
LNVPDNLKYTKSHEWVRVDGELATVGITDFAQSELGDIVFVELPAVGRKVSAEETIGSVESVKTVSDLYAPIKGEVVETNPLLASQSELINEDPYGQGWILKVRLEGDAPEALLDPESYKATLGA